MRAIVFFLAVFSAAIAAAQTKAIIGARVFTLGPDGTLENATIVIEGDAIVDVGTDVAVPTDAERIDASGKTVTPGIFTPMSQIGVTEVSAVEGTNDGAQRGDRFSASFDVATAYNPRSTLIPINRIEGVTRAVVLPRPGFPDEAGNMGRVFSGLASVVQFGDAPEHVVKRNAAMVVNLGETGSMLATGSRAAALMTVREALDDAIDFGQNKAAFDRGQRREYSVSASDLEALQGVLDRSIPMLVYVNRASDISALLDRAGEYNIRVIIAGGAEAWMVAADLAAANVPVILDAINNLPGNFERINARLDSAALLADAGVSITLDSGSLGPGATHNARNITQAAGIAVAYGLPWVEALEAITLAPAEIFGVDDQVGTIEAGMDADLVIWSDDPLELTSYPDQVFIRGEAVPMQSRQTLLRDRYLQADTDRPPAFRN